MLYDLKKFRVVAREKISPVFAKIFLVGLSLSAGFAAIEIGFRISSPSGQNNNQVQVMAADERGNTIHTKNLDTDIFSYEQGKMVRIRTNREGFIGGDYALEKPAGVLRIAVLGDSFVEGIDVGTENNFTSLLEKNLNTLDSSRKYEVMNFGVGGQGTMEELQRYDFYVKKYQPDWVFLVFYPNDFENNQYYLSYRDLISKQDPGWKNIPLSNANNKIDRQDLKFKLLQNFRTIQYLDSLFRSNVNLFRIAVKLGLQHAGPMGVPQPGIHPTFLIYQKPLPESHKEIFDFTAGLIKLFQKQTEDNKTKLAVIFMPEAIQVDKKLWRESLKKTPELSRYVWGFDQPGQFIKKAAGESGALFFDLSETLKNYYAAHPDLTLYNQRDKHLNEEGNRIVSQDMQKLVERLR